MSAAEPGADTRRTAGDGCSGSLLFHSSTAIKAAGWGEPACFSPPKPRWAPRQAGQRRTHDSPDPFYSRAAFCFGSRGGGARLCVQRSRCRSSVCWPSHSRRSDGFLLFPNVTLLGASSVPVPRLQRHRVHLEPFSAKGGRGPRLLFQVQNK